MYLVKFTKQTAKEAKTLKSAGLDEKAKELITIIENDPFAYPPSFEPLVGSLQGMYSRRINRQHRLVYEVIEGFVTEKESVYRGTVKVLSMWTHYESI